MLDNRSDRPNPRNSSNFSIPPSLDQLVGLSLECRAEVVLRHGRLDINRSIARVEAANLKVPASLADRIAWAVAWNIGDGDSASSSSVEESRKGLRGYRRRWSPDTGWGQIWQSLTSPLGNSNPGPDRVLLDELALSVLCEQRESWQPESAWPVNLEMANWAFEFVYRHNNEKIIGDIRRTFADRAGSAEDIAGEAWARVYSEYWSREARRRFLGLSRISTMVCQVARYVAIDAIREKGHTVKWHEVTAGDEERGLQELHQLVGVELNPSEYLLSKELRLKIDECIGKLAARQQIIAELVWLQEKSSKEAAALLGVSEPAISQHLKKAREGIRQCLERHGYRIQAP